MIKNNENHYVQHFSTRIPWKDNVYTGKIDDNPKSNIVAQVISGIAASRNLEFEEENKGKTIVALLPDSGDRYFSTALFAE